MRAVALATASPIGGNGAAAAMANHGRIPFPDDAAGSQNQRPLLIDTTLIT
jgi:hypothetical protein